MQDKTNYIVKIRDAVRTRNQAVSMKKKDGIHFVIFKFFAGIVGVLLTLVAVGGIAFYINYELEDFIPYELLIPLTLLGCCSMFGIIIFRAVQLKKQKDVHGDYVDYDGDVREYEEVHYDGIFTHSHRGYEIPIIDFAAHNLLTLFASPKDHYKPAIKLTDDQLKLGALILKQSANNKVLKMAELEKVAEYRSLEHEERTKLLNSFVELDLIAIHNTAAGKSIVQIDNPRPKYLGS